MLLGLFKQFCYVSFYLWKTTSEWTQRNIAQPIWYKFLEPTHFHHSSFLHAKHVTRIFHSTAQLFIGVQRLRLSQCGPPVFHFRCVPIHRTLLTSPRPLSTRSRRCRCCCCPCWLAKWCEQALKNLLYQWQWGKACKKNEIKPRDNGKPAKKGRNKNRNTCQRMTVCWRWHHARFRNSMFSN